MTTIITPTIGRRLWYWPSQYDLGRTPEQISGTAASSSPPMYQVHEGQPFDAGIVFVWRDHMVNLVVTDHGGVAHPRTSVRLLQGDDQRRPGEACATWMPYQLGQAQAASPQTPYPCPTPAKAPTVTLDQVEAEIVATHYFRADEGVFGAEENTYERRPTLGVRLGDAPLSLLTFCVLVLKNGFTVTGQSACASPAKFDTEMGRQIAREDAIRKVWPLLGYQLRQKLHEVESTDAPIEMGRKRIDAIARVCHEVNRAYCQALGDMSQPAWEDAPEWQRESARMGVDLHLMGDFGPEASHINWMKQKVDDGWIYGPEKNPELKMHPCIRPFDELPKEQQAKDYIFRAVVHAVATP